MKAYLVRRSTLVLAAVTAATLLAGCQDKRVKALQTGITRDSLLSITAQGTQGADSMPSIYKRDDYLINGKMLEVLYFDPNNRKVGKDTVPMGKLTPLVLYDNKLVAKGWAGWDSVAKANKIPVVKR
jgi:uncharacterized protein YycO